MEEKQYPMTKQALKALNDELSELLEVKKPELAGRLKAAIAMGDLSENADYISAKEDQAFLEGRILAVREMIQGAVIIKPGSSKDGVISIGSHVVVLEEGGDDEEKYQIVGMVEADPASGLISDESPLGSALLGHKKGDVVTITAPAGEIRFRIISVK
jgi:transcription elongation factor GreA